MNPSTDATGQEQLFSFDAWGQRRNALDWSELLYGQLNNFDTSITTRGFTGPKKLCIKRENNEKY